MTTNYVLIRKMVKEFELYPEVTRSILKKSKNCKRVAICRSSIINKASLQQVHLKIKNITV